MQTAKTIGKAKGRRNREARRATQQKQEDQQAKSQNKKKKPSLPQDLRIEWRGIALQMDYGLLFFQTRRHNSFFCLVLRII